MTLERHPFFATCAAGAEVALRDELRELGLRRVRADRGGARFFGPLREGQWACLRSRIAHRVLLEVGRFDASSPEALYEGVRAVGWERWLTPRHTLAVTAVAKGSKMSHTNFLAQQVKDAVVDAQRDQKGVRSSVDRHDADLAIFLHLRRDEAGLFLDLAGRSLHQRGWRREAGPAPLKETLAAAILRIGGWDRERPLVDPFCGSGTFPIEADLWARGAPTHDASHRYGFERWADHDASAAQTFAELRERAASESRAEGPLCLGRDREASVVQSARANATRASSKARFEIADAEAFDGLERPGHLVANPPYGHRLEADRALFETLDGLIRRLEGWAITVLMPDPWPEIGPRPPDLVHKMRNGRLETAILGWRPEP